MDLSERGNKFNLNFASHEELAEHISNLSAMLAHSLKYRGGHVTVGLPFTSEANNGKAIPASLTCTVSSDI